MHISTTQTLSTMSMKIFIYKIKDKDKHHRWPSASRKELLKMLTKKIQSTNGVTKIYDWYLHFSRKFRFFISLTSVFSNRFLLISFSWNSKKTQWKTETLTLFMYLQPQPDLFEYLHPHSVESIFQSQLFAFSIEQLDGCCCCGCGSGSIGDDTSVRSVIPGIVSIDGESNCGDNDCMRGKSISIILISLELHFSFNGK